MSLIELQQVEKQYAMGETTIAALRGINLTIRAGEFVAVWGPSGSGKSTLCNIVGLLDVPTKGRLFIEGRPVSDLSDDRLSEQRNRRIGIVFQGFNLIPVLSALENVMLPLQIMGRNSNEARDAAMRRLTELGLGEYTSHRPQKLSGGQQQRVAIARALVTDPAVVIADEPTANLDSKTALGIIELMRRINREHGTTFIFSTHDQRLLDRVGRLVLLEDGLIAEDRSNGAEEAETGSGEGE